jgi:hypothetical protein
MSISRALAVASACALLSLLGLAGCAASQHDYLRPWFRITTSPEHVIAPHALAWGGVRRPEVRIDGRWLELPHGGAEHGDFRVEPVGSALAVQEYSFSTAGRDPMEDPRRMGATGVFVYHAGEREPVRISARQCPTPRISETPAEITCFACGTSSPGSPLHPDQDRPACDRLQIRRYDSRGALLGRRALPCPIVEPDVEGRLPTGEWIVAEAKSSTDFLFLYGPRVRYQLDSAGLLRLDFGADPLSREIDAARRAQEILREVPIRDAALAALRAAFFEDERRRPGWVMQAEAAQRMGAGQSIEPRIATRRGRCYALVVRATPAISGLEVSVSQSYPTVGESLSHFDDPPLARSSGASLATLHHCGASGKPQHLEFRVEATAGHGYLVARIYEYRPRAPRALDSRRRREAPSAP